MQLNIIEQDIRKKEASLRRCKNSILAYVMKDRSVNTEREIELLSQELFLLEDQLSMYRVVANILKEEQESCDEMLPKV